MKMGTKTKDSLSGVIGVIGVDIRSFQVQRAVLRVCGPRSHTKPSLSNTVGLLRTGRIVDVGVDENNKGF